VIAEVLDHMVDRLKGGNVVDLDLAALEKFCHVEGLEDAIDFGDGFFEPADEDCFRQRTAGGEFCIPIAMGWNPAQTLYDPLAHVAA
jgi:hypothetical protein